jgi:hypothetical protein
MSEETNTNGVDVAVEVAGQKVNLKNVKSINTLATILTLVLVSLVAFVVWTHSGDTKEASKELTGALKEMTQAARESNCLMALPMDRRADTVELCKRISR